MLSPSKHRAGSFGSLLVSPFGLQLFDGAFHFARLGEAVDGVLREHQLIVGTHVEHAVGAADELSLDAEALLE